MASNPVVRTLARPWVLAPLLAAAPGAVFAAEPASALRIDGQPTESVWARAEPIVAFVVREPNEGATPAERTEARVLYDDQMLYVAVRAFDSRPDEIKAFLTRRDMTSSSDWIRVYIDSYHDRRSAYSFAVNPLGVKIDTYHFNDIKQDDSWDAVWDVAVARDASGWRAEFRIPLSQLRFGDDTSGTLGFAVARTLARLNETSTQPFVSAGAYRGDIELARPLASRTTDRYSPFAYDDDADFDVLTFRATNVFRWEYRPGSTLFVVWQQGRDGSAPRPAWASDRTSVTCSPRPRRTLCW
jgi:hypothetical protein